MGSHAHNTVGLMFIEATLSVRLDNPTSRSSVDGAKVYRGMSKEPQGAQ